MNLVQKIKDFFSNEADGNCVECHYCTKTTNPTKTVGSYQNYICCHPATETLYEKGGSYFRDPRDCRSNGACGRDARFFKPKSFLWLRRFLHDFTL